ncbi:unnamed protein product, partial [Urochloa humidicola]
PKTAPPLSHQTLSGRQIRPPAATLASTSDRAPPRLLPPPCACSSSLALPAALERPAARSANSSDSSDSGGGAAADVGLALEEVDGDGDGGARRDGSLALACRSRSRWRGVPSDVTGTKPGARVVASICAEFPQLRWSSYVILARAPADWFRFRSTSHLDEQDGRHSIRRWSASWLCWKANP